MGSYKILEDKIDEGDEIEITNDKQLRNLTKKLNKKTKLLCNDSNIELINEIKRIQCAINEYNSRNVDNTSILNSKKENKTKIEDEDEDRFLENEIKRMKKLRIKEERIKKIRGKDNRLNPHWTIKKHVLFPGTIKNIILLLIWSNKYENKSILYLLPNEILLKIYENIR